MVHEPTARSQSTTCVVEAPVSTLGGFWLPSVALAITQPLAPDIEIATGSKVLLIVTWPMPSTIPTTLLGETCSTPITSTCSLAARARFGSVYTSSTCTLHVPADRGVTVNTPVASLPGDELATPDPHCCETSV